eukprot:scaffold127927_cov36-Prasinocladus_malaysianus.AAC.2
MASGIQGHILGITLVALGWAGLQISGGRQLVCLEPWEPSQPPSARPNEFILRGAVSLMVHVTVRWQGAQQDGRCHVERVGARHPAQPVLGELPGW